MDRVAIVGAGPAGLFAAQELAELYDVKIIERSPMAGGSGLNSDGKLIFHPQIGGNLTEFLPRQEAENVIDSIDKTFQNYGVEQNDNYDEERLEMLSTKAEQAGMKFIKTKHKHIGSDRLHEIIERFRTDLENKGVEFSFATEVTNLNYDSKKITGIDTTKGTVPCDFLILAPGRTGSLKFKNIYDKLGLQYIFNPVDIGVRIEFPSSLMREIVEDYKCWDPKFYIRTRTHDDRVRTFCTCPYGYVFRESYGDSLFGVNGYSEFKTHSNNTNLALLVTVELTEPTPDTTEFGRITAYKTNMLGGGKPLIQTYGDFRRGRRSKPESIKKNHVEPTLGLNEVTPGDIGFAYDYRLVVDILEALGTLNKVIPGIVEDSTLLYVPEIKFYARRVATLERDRYKTLQTFIPNLFVAGDGAGVSRGIVGAAATGIIAAREIKST